MELIERYRAQLPADGQRALDMLHKEVHRFSSMVSDLLEISRLDAGAANLDLEDVPVDELVRRAVAPARPDVPVVVSDEAGGVLVRVDKRRIQRVLANLLDNADVHAGGPTRVTVERRAGNVVIGVDDAGPGIAPEDQERVFERFFRGAAGGNREVTRGTGLGLALAFEHVQAHGGRLAADNLAPRGARFSFTVPVVST